MADKSTIGLHDRIYLSAGKILLSFYCTVVTDKSMADQLLETQRMNFVHLVDI